MLVDVVRAALSSVAAMVLVTGLGWAVLRGLERVGVAVGRGGDGHLFACAATGLVLFTAGTALVITGGRSVMLGLLLLAPLLVMALRSTATPSGDNSGGNGPGARALADRGAWGALAAAALLPLIFFLGQHFQLPGEAVAVPYQDHAFYAVMAAGLDATGIESNNGLQAILRPDLYAPNPYHYLDLWLAVGLHRLFGLTYLASYQVALPTLLSFVVVLGLWAVIEQLGPVTAGRRLFALAFLGFTALWSPLFSEIPLLQQTAAFNPVVLGTLAVKVLVLDLCLVSFAVLTLRGNLLAACIVLAGALYFSVGYLGLTAAAGMVLLLGLVSRRWRPRQVWAPAAALLVTLGYFAWFYFSNRAPPAAADAAAATATPFGLTPAAVLRALFSPDGVRVRINIVGKSVIQLAVIFAVPAALAGAALWRLRTALPPAVKTALATLLVISGMGLAAYLVAHVMSPDDSVQFFTYVVSRCLALGIFLGLAVAMGADSTGRWWRGPQLAFVAYLVVANFLRHVPEQPAMRARTYVDAAIASRPQSRVGAYLRAPEAFVPGLVQSMNVVYPQGAALMRHPAFVGAVSIADLSRPRGNDTPQLAALARTAVFRVHHDRERARNPALTEGQAQRHFLQTHKIDWLILEPKSSLPAELRALVAQEIRDPLSGERFVRLAL